MDKLSITLQIIIKELYGIEFSPQLSQPEEKFGDAATNAAIQLAGQLKRPPAEVAGEIAAKLADTDFVAEATVAGPGFINVRFSDGALWDAIGRAAGAPASWGTNQRLQGKSVVAEYSDPNPFKVLHAGHLYTSIVGDAIANLLESAGATVHRVNFGGDVGRHVAQTMWAIIKELNGENPEGLDAVAPDRRASWMAERYVAGTNAYQDDETAKAEIIALNKRIYDLHEHSDHDSPLGRLYWTTRQWSYDYFDEFYRRIGSRFEKYYPESEVAGLGLQTVREHIGTVFSESNGAVIFDGEAYGLHTRVFINSEDLPTYETKDVGLIMAKQRDYHFDVSVVITGNEQAEYMKVVLKAIEQFEPVLAASTRHLTHGIVKLAGGQKMSSRRGNILAAADVLDAAEQANNAANQKDDPSVPLGAVKYAMLKHRLGGDIIYDAAESVSLTGNSGPYLQYALVRAKSIQKKAGSPAAAESAPTLMSSERSLVRKISSYPEVVLRAGQELMPHHVANYLFELAQTFNQFYESAQIIGDERQDIRLAILAAYAATLSGGLGILGIPTPETM